MKQELFVLYNNLSNRYGDVFSFPTIGFALKRLKTAQIDTSEFELCSIGTMDIETGAVELNPIKRIPWYEDLNIETKINKEE